MLASRFAACAVFVRQFLRRCASSENDHVGCEPGNRLLVPERDLIVGNCISVPQLVPRSPFGSRAFDDRGGLTGAAGELTRPLRFERRRADDEDTRRLARLAQVLGRGNRLKRLAETHVIGKHRASRRREEDSPAHLVRIELHAHGLPLLAARVHRLEERPLRLGTPAAIGRPCEEGARVIADPQVETQLGDGALERGERGHALAEPAALVEEPLEDPVGAAR